ncbi:DUF2484 family protein [Cognatishimia activa]|uniref:DUF2484 family protein n=1 Tax=Cognatishimia activa TaxID=1715691 RepID=A0A0P1IUC0_9RHOB|nr:DUF2484 family protein [Cognatishimia activa]CUJ20126.1 hypothetical protein TA5113_02622 [Cognatishimia activa]CUK25511.1 hypothetical protein TA5114_01310 [Cognatishimia activa]
MSLSFIAALIWMVVVNLRGMFPSKDHHWKFAYAMIAIGVPILIWVYIDHGLLLALILLLGAMWVMRWPVIYLTRWIRRQVGL